jgi:hypothetical protein
VRSGRPTGRTIGDELTAAHTVMVKGLLGSPFRAARGLAKLLDGAEKAGSEGSPAGESSRGDQRDKEEKRE